MFLVGVLSWWYGGGWLGRVQIIKDRLKASADLFSVRILATTLFAPFRQISAASVDGSFNDKIRAFFDKMLSCAVGAVVRTILIIFGLIAMLVQIFFGTVVLVVWLIIPFLPAIGLIGLVIGWVPR